jgi:hypothetical protein
MTDRLTRRQFAGTVASSSSLVLVAAGQANDADPKAAQKTAAGKEPADKESVDKAKQEQAEEKKSTLELITQIARQEFPHEKLDAQAIEEIRTDVAGNLMRSRVLSAFPLLNSDEPGFVFAAWRKDFGDQ